MKKVRIVSGAPDLVTAHDKGIIVQRGDFIEGMDISDIQIFVEKLQILPAHSGKLPIDSFFPVHLHILSREIAQTSAETFPNSPHSSRNRQNLVLLENFHRMPQTLEKCLQCVRLKHTAAVGVEL